MAVSVLSLCGTYTTEENIVFPVASAASTRSPATTDEISLTSPDSITTVSEPAKQLFNEDATGDAIAEITDK
jgi:hypothetical protein